MVPGWHESTAARKTGRSRQFRRLERGERPCLQRGSFGTSPPPRPRPTSARAPLPPRSLPEKLPAWPDAPHAAAVPRRSFRCSLPSPSAASPGPRCPPARTPTSGTASSTQFPFSTLSPTFSAMAFPHRWRPPSRRGLLRQATSRSSAPPCRRLPPRSWPSRRWRQVSSPPAPSSRRAPPPISRRRSRRWLRCRPLSRRPWPPGRVLRRRPSWRLWRSDRHPCRRARSP